MTDWPRITIITPSFNQANFLESTIESVLQQRYPNLEYLIIDGGSTDGSSEIIQKYAPHLAFWTSEPDQGQSDAIHKGIERSTGEILNWLNSDDLLLPGALHLIAKAYRETKPDILVGEDLLFTESPDKPVQHFQPANYEYPSCIKFWSGTFRYHQPCTFFTRDVYEQSGGLNRFLHCVMDYDLYCRMLAIPGLQVHYLNQPISAFRLHPEAKTALEKPLFIDEFRKAASIYWQKAGLTISDWKDMNRFCAHCSVHQASEALKGRQIGSFFHRIKRALLFSPSCTVTYAFRLFSRHF